jgi:uncharacterized protein DUF5681
VNPNSLKNLTPFKPGQSGNPTGRPKKRLPITDRYVALLESPIEENERKKLKLPKGATNADAIVLQVIRLARKGNLRAIKEICDRVEGKPSTRVEREDRSIERPSIRVIYDRDERAPRTPMKKEVTDSESSGNAHGKSERSGGGLDTKEDWH